MRKPYPSNRRVKKSIKKMRLIFNSLKTLCTALCGINNAMIKAQRLIKTSQPKLIEGGIINLPKEINKNTFTGISSQSEWLKMYSPLMFENECLNKPKPVFPNIELRELTPEEIANKKPKGRFQLRAEDREKQDAGRGNSTHILETYNPEVFTNQRNEVIKALENANKVWEPISVVKIKPNEPT